jgi:hypothetical protein
MKKRINFTGRKTFPLGSLKIRIHEPKSSGEPANFSAELNVPRDWRLNMDAKVYVEPYISSSSSSMRFCFGTVGNLTSSPDTTLLELDRSNRILFRVKVVDESTEIGKILASANRIQPVDEEGIKALLPLKLTDLGEDVWKVILDGGPPVLELNNRIPGLRDRLMQDPLLQGSIYPQALRQILQSVLTNDELDDEIEWVSDWKTLASRLLGEEISDDLAEEGHESDLDDVVEKTVKSFCVWRRFASSVNKFEEKIFNG